jgi:hypothetical protein
MSRRDNVMAVVISVICAAIVYGMLWGHQAQPQDRSVAQVPAPITEPPADLARFVDSYKTQRPTLESTDLKLYKPTMVSAWGSNIEVACEKNKSAGKDVPWHGVVNVWHDNQYYWCEFK